MKATRGKAVSKKERRELIAAAIVDECQRINDAIKAGAVIIIPTAFGRYQVTWVQNFDIWGVPEGTLPGSRYNQRWFMGANDGTWADIMQQAGQDRNLIFKLE